MLSVVIPALNAAPLLERTLTAALSAPGLDDVVVADGGSRDGTPAIAERLGARVITAPRGRGAQLAAGAAAAGSDWLFFLHADTRPGPGWEQAVAAFMADPANATRAAVFELALDDAGAGARRLARLANWRTRALGLPYGDQGLILRRDFYESLGGFRPIPLMEDVDLIRRIGRRRLVVLPVPAITSAARYRREGYLRRAARNLVCLGLYFLGVPPKSIARLYHTRGEKPG